MFITASRHLALTTVLLVAVPTQAQYFCTAEKVRGMPVQCQKTLEDCVSLVRTANLNTGAPDPVCTEAAAAVTCHSTRARNGQLERYCFVKAQDCALSRRDAASYGDAPSACVTEGRTSPQPKGVSRSELALMATISDGGSSPSGGGGVGEPVVGRLGLLTTSQTQVPRMVFFEAQNVDEGSARRVSAHNARQLTACLTEPGVARIERLRLTLTLGANGSVTQVAASSVPVSATVERCGEKTAKAWTFVKPMVPTGARVTAEFEFDRQP